MIKVSQAEKVTIETLDEKTMDLFIAYLTQYDNIEKVMKKTGVSKDEFLALLGQEDFRKKLYLFKRDCAKTIIRDPYLPEPILQWQENKTIEVLPLFYNFDDIDNDEKLQAFINEYNIYVSNWIYTMPDSDKYNIRRFKYELQELKKLIDKYLINGKLSIEELTLEEKIMMENAHAGKSTDTLISQGNGYANKYKNATNYGSFSMMRVYADMWDVIHGKKQLKKCANPKCNKIFVPRKEGGRKQEYHDPVCARRVRQLKYKRRKSNKVYA